MITTILIVSLAFYWLLFETDYLRIRLPVGNCLPDFPQRWFDTFNMSQWQIDSFDKTCIPLTNPDYEPIEHIGYVIYETLGNRVKFNHNQYQIGVSPNVAPMCGEKWLDDNWNHLENYKPELYMDFAGVRYNMTIKKPEIIKDVMKANKLNKTERKMIKAGAY